MKALFVKAQWNKEAEKQLERVYAEDGMYFMLEALRNQIEQEQAFLYECRVEQKALGYVVTRVDEVSGLGLEYVIVAAAIDPVKGAGWFRTCLSMFEDEAKRLGCVSFRMHSTKHGMWRMFENAGYEQVERVYTKGL